MPTQVASAGTGGFHSGHAICVVILLFICFCSPNGQHSVPCCLGPVSRSVILRFCFSSVFGFACAFSDVLHVSQNILVFCCLPPVSFGVLLHERCAFAARCFAAVKLWLAILGFLCLHVFVRMLAPRTFRQGCHISLVCTLSMVCFCYIHLVSY